jgi:hypothetical protein
MDKIVLKVRGEGKVQDPNARAMWGRCKSQTFRDRTKYSRKAKHPDADGL